MSYPRTATLLSAAIAMTLVLAGIGLDSRWASPLIAAAVLLIAGHWFGLRVTGSRDAKRTLIRWPGVPVAAIAQDLSASAGIASPTLFVLRSDVPNAFASGRRAPNASIAVTAGLLSSLSEREIRGVLAHEIAHIVRRDARFLTLAAVGCGLVFGALGGLVAAALDPAAGLAIVALSTVAAALCQMSISRAREHAADRLGAAICGNPLWIAAALERIETLALPAGAAVPRGWALETYQFGARRDRVLSLLSTHPPIGERIFRLRRLAGLTDPWV